MQVVAGLRQRGYGEDDLHKLLKTNAVRALDEIWQERDRSLRSA